MHSVYLPPAPVTVPIACIDVKAAEQLWPPNPISMQRIAGRCVTWGAWCRGTSQSLQWDLLQTSSPATPLMSDNMPRALQKQDPAWDFITALGSGASHHWGLEDGARKGSLNIYAVLTFSIGLCHDHCWIRAMELRHTFDPAPDVDWWVMVALRINKKDKLQCCDLL